MSDSRLRMIKASSAAAVVLVTGLAASAAQPGQLPTPKGKLARPVVEVPMDLGTRHPVIEVKVNGKGPFRFVYDTGAGGTVIDDDLAAQLDLPELGQALVADASGGAPKPAKLVKVDAIAVGDATFSDSMAVIMDLDPVFRADDGPTGVLAFRTFADYLVTLDYPRANLVLQEGSLPPANGKDILEYSAAYRIPVLSLSIGDHPVEIGIDSGASVGCALAATLEGKIRLIAEPVPVAKARRANTEMVIREARLDASLQLGEFVVKDPIVHFAGVMSVIGYPVLKNLVITFDQQAETVRFSRKETDPITIPSRYAAGFGTESREGVRKVWYVLDRSPAAKAGLKAGDRITSVNGRPVSDFGHAEWRALTDKPGTLELKILRDDKPVEISVAVIEYVK